MDRPAALVLMKVYRRRCALPVVILLAIVAATPGCNFWQKSAKVIPPPPPAPRLSPPPPPEIQPGIDARTPVIITTSLREAAFTPETTALLDRAEAHFRAGKQFFNDGDAEGAREQFDLAIDVLLDAPADAWDRYRVSEKCEELVEAIYAYNIEGLDTGFEEKAFAESPLDGVLAATFPVDPSIELDVHTELKLPVSELPIEVNDAVMHYIRYFQTQRGREVLADRLQRQGRYRDMILRILAEEGIPQELISLAMAESGFKPRAVSRKRATGMWQFMRLRAREYGLKRTRDYDDRLDPEKATRAAARHLRDLYERLGGWYLAMAAYNGGPGRVLRAVRRTGYADFWEFYYRKALPRETRNHVPIILAMAIMSKSPGEYGLEDIEPDPRLEYNTLTMNARTHLGLIADILGQPLDELRELNPALLGDFVPAGYTVHVPEGTGVFVTAALETVPPGRRASWRVHRVGHGDTIEGIARMYRTTEESIAGANGGELWNPHAGDLLLVPVSYSQVRKGASTGKKGAAD
ncbi:MAG: transglycosylase SLT domain-containing protein, partial [bacterium]|nr:transglycosylase SLT domain-containing protein [bacterium]